jgi:hypothetical protein
MQILPFFVAKNYRLRMVNPLRSSDPALLPLFTRYHSIWFKPLLFPNVAELLVLIPRYKYILKIVKGSSHLLAIAKTTL